MSSPAALPAQPIPAEKSALAAQLIQGLDTSSLQWLSGYMAGAAAQLAGHSAAPTAVPTTVADKLRLTVLYGSQTGNAKRIAEELVAKAEAAGVDVRLVRADAYAFKELKKEQLLYVVISTHSEGDEVDPPDDSRDFLEKLGGRRAPKLPELKYAVLALGDSSYPDFCGIGRQVDERLAELGAERLFERGEADVDIETIADPWRDTALEKARELNDSQPVPTPGGAANVVTPLHPERSTWSRQNPFHAEVLTNQRIVASDSGKDVRHIELLLEGSGLSYQPGDALGVWPTQDDALVGAVLDTLQLDGDTEVAVKDDSRSLTGWLTHHRELTALTKPFVAAHAERGGHADLQAVLEPDARAELAQLLAGTQLLDLLRQYPTDWDAQALVEALRPLAPRSYSIASSQEEVEDEVHLTVDRLHWEVDGEARWGVASRQLCDLAEGDTIPVFVDSNDRFRLPADPATDIVMIGPGTGIAPFRSFVQQRGAEAGEGRNWLFFGNPHRRTDFLYQLEWKQAMQAGHLHRLDVAFSRDQDHKVYVQHRIREHGAELWRWLDGGAQLYLCGDADHMAPDVHAALLDVIAEHGGKSADDAAAWLKQALADGRYARDVY